MNDVYLKNRTSSAITVAGYTVHYMDKTDAEIVEVEGSESISGSDDASGTISAITLPTAHSYTGVLFDSLRYYAKGTISNTGSVTNLWQSTSTWYYGTLTWTDESLGDLSDKIIVNSTSYSGMLRQTVCRIIFICDSNITGYHPMDTDSSQGQITNYSYNNGVHSITFYFAGTDWTSGTYSGRIQFRYLNGITTFNNLNAFDLVSASGGLLSKNTTTDRYDMYNVWNNSITIHAQYSVQNQVKYNAFKYLLSFVPYWYVIDGIQTDWTDDLSSIGYSEVVPLPTISNGGDFSDNNWTMPDVNASTTVSVLGDSSVVAYSASSQSAGQTYSYDSTKSYTVIQWQTTEGTRAGAIEFSVVDMSGNIGIKNNTANQFSVLQVRIAVCSSADATVVHVYDKSTGVAYNAFKYALEGIDYYYILDGVQSDWSDDIDSLGFALGDGFTEITLYGNVSSTIACQNNVTSGFTGDVNSANVLQLYIDNTYTTPWNGYDYSNDYEMGRYVDGVWYSRGGTIADLPSTTANPGNGETVSNLFILLDTGCLWFVCNNSNNIYGYNNQHAYFYGTITLRIYPKGQQWIPVFPYNPSYGEYDNLSTNRKGTFVRMSSPATVFGTFPAIAESFGYKSGMIKSASIQAELQISQAVLYINVVGNPALSNIIVRFENDICTGYVRSDKADLPTAPSYDGATYTLKDDDGNNIDYDDSFTYKFVLLLNSTGDTVGGTTSTGSMIKSSTGKLQVRIRYMSSKFNRVWYYRIPIS